MLSPITVRQFEGLRSKYQDSTLTELPSTAALVCIPNFKIPNGWNTQNTKVWFIVPAGYPGPCPDCFWADSNLRLASGAIPQAANLTNQIPEAGIVALWFSWHVQDIQKNWNPNRDELITYAGIIYDRFCKLQ